LRIEISQLTDENICDRFARPNGLGARSTFFLGNIIMNHGVQKLAQRERARSSPRRSKRSRAIVGALCALATVPLLSMPRTLKAQSIDHRVQLSLSANLLSHESLKLSSAGTSVSATDTAWGPGAAGLGFGLGYGVTDNWLLGVQLLGGSATSSLNGGGAADLKQTSYSVLPRVDYTFGLEQALRPYVGATLGLRGTSTSGAATSKTSSTELVFGASVGVRAFVSPGFSIDPGVTFLGSSGNERVGAARLDQSGFAFLIGVAFSGWVDTAASSPRPRADKASVPAPSNASATPEILLTTADDGTIRAEIAVAGRGRLRLLGRPILDGHEVLIELLGTGAESNQLAQCKEIRVLVDSSEQLTGNVPRPVPGSSSALELLVTPKLIEALARAEHSATIAICGTPWEISIEGRAALLKFFEQFRDSAKRYQRWDEGTSISRPERQRALTH
jgi:Outer membrane protein beta-barrel domain